MRVRTWLACALLMMFTARWAQAQSEPARIYMHPNGHDWNDGTIGVFPIQTLSRAQEVVAQLMDLGHRDIEIRIAPGTYHDQRVTWTKTMPNHSIKFMPWNDDKVRPVFDGSGDITRTWFKLNKSDGEPTNLIFHYIKVQNYNTAISLKGNRENQASGWNGNNTIYGCYFKDIGWHDSTAAVRLVNSDDNFIRNNHFVNIVENIILQGSTCGSLHAIYVAHNSERNDILSNRFENGCGDPVRVRDYSNGNSVKDNRFYNIGKYAYYSHWYCDSEVSNCTKSTPECPSWDNEFRNNELYGGWDGENISVFRYFQDDQVAGCSKPNPDSKRLRTSGNVKY